MNKRFILVLFMAFVSVFMLVGCGEITFTAISIDNDSEMNVGDKVAIAYTLEGVELADVVWTSSDESVIKIENMQLVALKEGTSTISAKAGDIECSIEITVKSGSVAISFELNDGTCEGLPTSRTASETITLPTPTKDGYSFDGWYENSDFSGEKVTTLNSANINIAKLYAKWAEKTYKVVYNFTDANGKTTKEEAQVAYKDAYTVASKSVSSSEVFTGWYKEEALINEVKTIEAKSVEEEVVNLYGKAIASTTQVKVTLDYNEGSTVYATRDEMIADFLKDYNYICKTSYVTIRQIGTSASGPGTFHTFYLDGVTEDGDKCVDKWAWLINYVYDLSAEKLDSSSYVYLGLKALVNKKESSKFSTNEKQGCSAGIRAFLMGMRIGTSNLKTVDFTNYSYANGFWGYLSSSESSEITVSVSNSNLPTPAKENYSFVGWFRDAEGTQGPVKNVYTEGKLYAKYDENTKVNEITITKKLENLIKFKTQQLEWTISPSDATVKSVTFVSSDPTIASVSEDGLITALNPGKVTIKLLSNSSSGAYDEYELLIYTPNYMEVSYDTVSYVTVGETIKLNATPRGKNYLNDSKVVWSSADETIATVKDGVVTGVKAGFVKINAKTEDNATSFDFGVTVLAKDASDIIKFIAKSNSGNVYTTYDLGIGAGTPVYYMDVIGSVSKLIYNKEYVVNTTYEAAQRACSYNHGGEMSSVEFITVHYTGNMSSGATAAANASYFSTGGGSSTGTSGTGTSIHYVTGNDGIYSSLADNLVGRHAGDGTDVEFKWSPTGVMLKDGDPQYPVWGISKNSKFTLNGQETTIDVPTGNASKSPNTVKVTGDTFIYNGVEQPCINDMGLPFTIVNGEYYMGTTWWCYTQVEGGRICSKGGNNNSIGIESAVNEGSDLWYTWHLTAQLVAHLMVQNNLDITRVVGHHFFTAKDCPQPMLENDLEIWWVFKSMIEAEYELLTKYSNYEITMTVNDGVTNVNNYGRVLKQMGDTCQSVNYTVTVKNKTTGATESITLGGIVQSVYQK